MSEERTQNAHANNGDWQNAQVSIVSSVTGTKAHDIAVSEVLQGIRDGRWSNPVSHIRDKHASAYNEAIVEGNPDPAAFAKKAVGPLKKKLPAVTFRGVQATRNGSLLTHSGILCIDIDDHSDCEALREKLKGDPHVLTAFISPTGAGLKVLMRILPDSGAHDLSFRAAKRHFKTRYALDIDNCPDLSRLCFVSHDPEIFIRSGSAEILEPEEPEPAAPPPQRDDEAKPGNEDQRTGENEQTIPGGLMFLPGGLVGNLRSAESIFGIIARRDPPTMFVRGGCVVRINENPEKAAANSSDDGKVRIDDVSVAGFRSQVEAMVLCSLIGPVPTVNGSLRRREDVRRHSNYAPGKRPEITSSQTVLNPPMPITRRRGTSWLESSQARIPQDIGRSIHHGRRRRIQDDPQGGR